MSKDLVPRFIAQAEEKEKKYDWFEAVEFHEKALAQVLKQKDFLKAGEVQEKIGYCRYRAAFQAETQQEFKQTLGQAAEAYEKAAELYGKLIEPKKTSRILRCEAMLAFAGFWLASEVPEKKRLIDECWRLTKEALKGLDETGSALEYVKTYNQLSMTAFFDYALTWDFQTREKTIREATEYGERTIALFSRLGGSYELARAYVKTAFYLTIVGIVFTSDLEEKERHYKKGLDYWQKATELSEETAFLELLSFSGESMEGIWSRSELLVQYEKALGYAKKTKDRYLIGTALDYLVYAVSGKVYETEDPDKRLQLLQKTLQYAEGAKQQFSSISFVSPRSGTFGTGTANAEYYLQLANWETDVRKKQDLLKKALMDGTRALKQAESTGYPDIIRFAHAILGGVLTSLARIETNSEEKRKLLEKALEHRKEYINIASELQRFFYWNLGYGWNALAGTQGELATVEKNVENRKKMLMEAASFMERGVQLCSKDIPYFEKIGDLALFALLGFYQYNYGELLNRLYELTNNNEHQRRAINVFEEAAQSYQKLNMVSRMAECSWKAGISCDRLGEHLKATEYFHIASNDYFSAAEKIPQLKDFYQDHARYMDAWSEIERARHYHKRQDYGKAKESYQKSANLHQSTMRWNYLAPNYSAWARLEEAEDISRKEQTVESRDLFQQAAELFSEAQKSIKDKLERIEEKEMEAGLATASKIRKEYCLGRVALEEAKILDRRGDHASSSRKYGVAAETFQKAIDTMTDEVGRRELEPIICLSRAWQLMTRAEAEASPDLYSEASQLFEEAKNLSVDEKARMLALGHSRFCRALEAGTRFEDTSDMAMYSTAKKYVEAAAKYYLKAGFRNASDYARATHRLFDAYMYMNKAEAETEPRKKTQYYQMAERLLQASAGSYMKAKHPDKSEEVQRLYESVKEERQLAMSLTEVLHVPTDASTTSSFSIPTSTREQAVGLERFEHADIQANLLIRVREVKVGEDVDFRIELVNAGKAAALLIKADEIVPEGFEVKEVPEIYTVEDRYLNMKGKRLNPLKTEDVKMVVKPKSKGTFRLKPRILYIDETGKYKSHEPEPVTITVEELGIKDWIKGER